MHKGKHKFENTVPQQQRHTRAGERIATNAQPVSSRTGAPSSSPGIGFAEVADSDDQFIDKIGKTSPEK